jgi:hypothetical protein
MDTREIFRLKKEITDLLRERPELVPFQRKIDDIMRGAVTQQNKCAILHGLMLDHLKLFTDHLELLISKH